MVVYLKIDFVIELNRHLLSIYSPDEIIGVKNRAALESALYRPQTTFNQKELYDTIWLKAAALFESMVQNHPFHNGNKRTGLSAMMIFLSMNNIEFKGAKKATEDFTVFIVTEKPDLNKIAKWIQQNSIENN